MTFYNISDIPGFFKAVDECKGDVYLVTKEGDKLNLKSQITKYIAFSEFFKNTIADDLELEFTVPEDSAKMISYILYK